MIKDIINIKLLRQLREQAELTQSELSEKIGFTSNIISKIERREKVPTLPEIIKIADFFGISLDTLTNRDKHIAYLSETEIKLINLSRRLCKSNPTMLKSIMNTLEYVVKNKEEMWAEVELYQKIYDFDDFVAKRLMYFVTKND